MRARQRQRLDEMSPWQRKAVADRARRHRERVAWAHRPARAVMRRGLLR